MKKRTNYLLLLSILLFTACKLDEKSCPNYFKIYNATNAKVDMNFYLNNKVAEKISIEPRSNFINNGSENDTGMPEYFSYVDSLVMTFDEDISLTYQRNVSPTNRNPFIISHYEQSKSDEDCDDNNEVVYQITSEHEYAAN